MTRTAALCLAAITLAAAGCNRQEEPGRYDPTADGVTNTGPHTTDWTLLEDQNSRYKKDSAALANAAPAVGAVTTGPTSAASTQTPTTGATTAPATP